MPQSPPPARFAAHAAFLLCTFGAPIRAAEIDGSALEFFESRVRPLLVERCYSCHSDRAKRPKGGLRLDTREAWMQGGESGPAIVPGRPDASRLIEAVRYENDELRMPPKGRLSDAEIADLVRWVELGAPDPRGDDGAAPATREDAFDLEEWREFWAFRPIADVDPPAVPDDAWSRNEIDRFIRAALEEQRLEPAPEADKPAWIRRATFDLIGLPPEQHEVDAFLADDSAEAYATVIDRLLDSPHYGERWGRGWLDVARYADSNGVDENLALANAWRYRDYVVRAFNEDKRFDRFLTEQLAGDLLSLEEGEPRNDGDFDRLIATGFLQLGPKMLAEQDKQKLVMDVVDEQIDVTSRAFLGLTVACARCHDHKFDPIATRDYYALAGIFKSTSTMETLDHVSRWREHELATPDAVDRRDRFHAEVKKREEAIAKLLRDGNESLQSARRYRLSEYLLAGDRAARSAVFVEAEEFSRSNLAVDDNQWGSPAVTVVHTATDGTQFVEFDVTVAAPGPRRLDVRYASGEPRPMRLIVNDAPVDALALEATTGSFFPDTQTWTTIGEVFLLPGRNVLRLEREGPVPHIDKILLASPDDGDLAWPVRPDTRDGLEPAVIRAWADFLVTTRRNGDPDLAVWHAFADVPAEEFDDGAIGATITLVGRIRDGSLRASRFAAALVEGMPPSSLAELASRYQTMFGVLDGLGPPAEEDVDAVASERRRLLAILHGPAGPFALPRAAEESRFPVATRHALAEHRARIEELRKSPPPPIATALGVRDGEAGDVPVHVRGSHLSLGDEPVPRGFLSIFDHVVPRPPIGAAESGRLQLARWLTDPRHPLTARVIVNRVWQGHFGRGLVATPSNFGRRGDAPTHPELLDWLARRFVADGWSLKALHRLIMASSTYRLSSRPVATNLALDPENRFLWRMNRRRLDAEAVRDGLLFAGGSLDRTVGGSLLQTKNRDYVTNDQSTNQARYGSTRRALYLPIIRNAMYSMFASFDYNDPSVPVARRPETTVAHQSLFLMNGPLTVEQSRLFAERVLHDPGASDDERIDHAWRIAFGRAASDAERDVARSWIDARREPEPDPAHPTTSAAKEPVAVRDRPDFDAWAGLCHALLSSNEFLYVD